MMSFSQRLLLSLMMETLEGAELCFPHLVNTSCRKTTRPSSEIVLIHIALSVVSLLTVALNLLVIISISHYRKLQTPTNLLLLSLAVTDLLVGLLVMPLEIMFMQSCWFLGDIACGLFFVVSFMITSVSVGNMVLISVERYVAICQPLLYSTTITQSRVQRCVCLCWGCSLFYNCLILKDQLTQPEKHRTCNGECGPIVSYIAGNVDMVVTFIGPLTVIIVLSMRVFVVAVSQARAMRSNVVSVVKVKEIVGRSERKAARTLGIVVVVFLLFFCPSYYLALSNVYPSGYWFLYLNSCLNPIIYALFYPWFRKAVKLIVTLQILFQPDSAETNIM